MISISVYVYMYFLPLECRNVCWRGRRKGLVSMMMAAGGRHELVLMKSKPFFTFISSFPLPKDPLQQGRGCFHTSCKYVMFYMFLLIAFSTFDSSSSSSSSSST